MQRALDRFVACAPRDDDVPWVDQPWDKKAAHPCAIRRAANVLVCTRLTLKTARIISAVHLCDCIGTICCPANRDRLGADHAAPMIDQRLTRVTGAALRMGFSDRHLLPGRTQSAFGAGRSWNPCFSSAYFKDFSGVPTGNSCSSREVIYWLASS